MAVPKARGVRIPERVAVVGFDNNPMAPVYDPSLTIIHYPMFGMGRACFELFAAWRRGSARPQST